MSTNEEVGEQLTKMLTDEGRLIEAGWQSMRIMAVPPTASDVQVSEMRKAFFAGAQHLLGSLMTMLDDTEEPTAEDLNRMELISNELAEFVDEIRHEMPPE